KKSGFPLNIKGEFTGKDIYINGKISSQFVSGIMMGAIIAKRSVNIHLTSELVSRGYVDMTIEVIKQFGSDVKQTEDGFEVICKNKVSIGCEFVPEVD
ncbi:MAG TPA: hypothetical protein PLZ09_07055, partial [Clostridia bacterium]|nr:hypothetical protein [Clostridia bacterium]